MGLLVLNVFLVIIILVILLLANTKASKQQKEISFLYSREQRARKIEEIRDSQQIDELSKRKKLRRQNKP
jgi:hypothetical protein